MPITSKQFISIKKIFLVFFNFTLILATQANTIEITSPTNATTFIEGDTVKIEAQATNNSSVITSVEFYVNDVLVGKDMTAPYKFDWICVEGTSFLTVKEIVGSCQDATSIPVQIVVKKNHAPQITLTSPANGGTYPDAIPITLAATASDSDGVVSKVDFFLNSIFVGSDATAPYQLNWKCIPGLFTVSAKAVDNKGAVTSANPLTVTVNPTPDSPPSVSITNPINGNTFMLGSPITIQANAADTDGIIHTVEFFANNQLIGVDSVAPYEINWPGTAGLVVLKAKATDNQCVSTISAPVTISIIDPNAPPYLIETVTCACSAPSFCLPIHAISPVKDILGYDITVKYDNTKVQPTGNVAISNDLIDASYASYNVNNVDSLSEIHIAVFLAANAPAQTNFNGIGELICIEFSKKSSFSANDSALFSAPKLQESYVTGVLQKQVTPGKYINQQNTNYPGVLKFWKDLAPIKYDLSDPAHFLITTVYGVDNTCSNKSIAVTQPDTLGKVSYNIQNGSSIQIQRDILPGTLVQPVINGMDASIAHSIVLNNLTFIPSVFQLIALDVNMDGVISAGDISQINQRVVGILPEFKQKWNYTANGNSNGQLSKDWLFVDSTLLASPAFKISSTYPLNDGVGYSKSKIPTVPFCIKIPASTNSNCNVYTEGTFTGILLGDVDGSYESIQPDGKLKRVRLSDDAIILDLSKSTKGKGYMDIPVSFSSGEKIVALDFSLKINSSTLNFSKLVRSANYLNDVLANYDEDHLLRFTSNSNKAYEANKPIATLRFLTSNEKIQAGDFSELTGYLNGEQVNFKMKDALSTNTDEAIIDSDIQIYPNPANELLNILVNERSTVQLLDIQGKEIITELNANENETVEIRTANLKSGTYLIKITNSHVIKTQQVVIENK